MNISTLKTCNPINCYYANEFIDADNCAEDVHESDECALCSYNFNHISKLRKFIKNELKK